MAARIKVIGIFGVRNDKQRGLIIETLQIKDRDNYFFQYQDQPVDRHCEQIQKILRSSNVKRMKRISVDITPFLTEYYRNTNETFVFKGTKLTSSSDQIQKALQMDINKEIGILKRKKTMANQKQAKVEEKNERSLAKLAKNEGQFQLEPANEITELFEERGRMTEQGETNPLVFLAEFEKRYATKNDQEKIHEIRHFVNEEDRDAFNRLCYTDDWPTVRIAFIKMFSLKFLKNQKREMNIDFKKETSLRSFVNRKLSSFAKYTTLPLSNQIEMVVNDLPKEVAIIFMMNGKIKCDKSDILDFCDSIEVQNAFVKHKDVQNENALSRSKIDSDDESDSTIRNQSPESEEHLAGPSHHGLGSEVKRTIVQLERSNERNFMSFFDELVEGEGDKPTENLAGPSRAGCVRGTGRVSRGKIVKPGRSNVRVSNSSIEIGDSDQTSNSSQDSCSSRYTLRPRNIL